MGENAQEGQGPGSKNNYSIKNPKGDISSFTSEEWQNLSALMHENDVIETLSSGTEEQKGLATRLEKCFPVKVSA